MNIVVATSAPSFWGPQAEQLAEAMREQGHTVRVATSPMRGSACDLLFCLGSGESLRPFLDGFAARRKILYLIESIPTLSESDDFTRSKLQAHQGYLHAFHWVFVHTRRSIPSLQSLGLRRVEELIWPHFPSIYRPVPVERRDLDVLFVGTLSPYRRQVLQAISSRFTVSLGNRVFHEQTGAAYSRARIVLNLHYTPLRNLECRVIEVLGCGAFLLTQALDPDDVFRDREHLVVFDETNVVSLVEHYLRDDAERERIAAAGHALVQQYRVENQVRRILEVGAQLLAEPDEANMSPLQQVTVNVGQQSFRLSYYPSAGMNDMFRELFTNNAYLFPDYLRDTPGVIVDVGANIGCASVLFGAFYPGKTVFAVEPAADTFDLLRKNVAALPNVRAFHCGLYDRDCTMKLYKGQVSSVTNSLATSAHNSAASEEVTLRRASAFLAEQGIDRISILKVDTEGAEVAILRDVQPLFPRIDAVYFEFHSEADRVELDRMLTSRFMLVHGKVHTAHRGVLCYVAREVIAARTNLDRLAIVPGQPVDS